MIRLFEFRDLDRIMEIWLEGNLKAHPFKYIYLCIWQHRADCLIILFPILLFYTLWHSTGQKDSVLKTA